MKWLLENIQVVGAIAAMLIYFLTRKAGQAARSEADEPEDPEQAERTRRIQEEIRRKIAERRGVAPAPTGAPVTKERIPPLVRPREVEPVDPFGGPLRRIVREFEQAMEPPPAVDTAAQAAELARQARLAEELRALEAARAAEVRRAAAVRAHAAAQKSPVPSLFKPGELRGALRDPRAARRAIVLREVLGTPVGLR